MATACNEIGDSSWQSGEGRHSSPGTFTGRWKKFYRIHGTKNDRR